TTSTDFPGTGGGAQSVSGNASAGGGQDAFVARLNAGLTTLGQATYLGGIGSDATPGLAIAPTTGDVYAAGVTDSTNFPGTRGGAESALAGLRNAFVARLNAGLTALQQATYLGGNRTDQAAAVAIAPTGDVYVAGIADSPDFPGTTGGAQPVHAGLNFSDDCFVARLNGTLPALGQSTFLGGGGGDFAVSVAL